MLTHVAQRNADGCSDRDFRRGEEDEQRHCGAYQSQVPTPLCRNATGGPAPRSTTFTRRPSGVRTVVVAAIQSTGFPLRRQDASSW